MPQFKKAAIQESHKNSKVKDGRHQLTFSSVVSKFLLFFDNFGNFDPFFHRNRLKKGGFTVFDRVSATLSVRIIPFYRFLTNFVKKNRFVQVYLIKL